MIAPTRRRSNKLDLGTDFVKIYWTRRAAK
jgi:hypothetical protein